MSVVVGAGPLRAYIGLGANLEDPRAQVERAIGALSRLPQTQLQARSFMYRSAPVGYAAQPDFINAVAALDTALSARELLQALLEIEQQHQRKRSFRNAPRTLDLDLLLYGDAVINEDDLVVPHPRMLQRAFVLLPLAEIAPDALVPGAGQVKDLLAAVADQAIERMVD